MFPNVPKFKQYVSKDEITFYLSGIDGFTLTLSLRLNPMITPYLKPALRNIPVTKPTPKLERVQHTHGTTRLS